MELYEESVSITVLRKYRYETEGDIIHCYPVNSGYINIDLEYFEDSECIFMPSLVQGGVDYEFFWEGNERPSRSYIHEYKG